jgi:hypothetical protein
MISAQTRFAFVARENRYPLFRIMLQRSLTSSDDASSGDASDGGDANPNACDANGGGANPSAGDASPSAAGPSHDDGHGPSALLPA